MMHYFEWFAPHFHILITLSLSKVPVIEVIIQKVMSWDSQFLSSLGFFVVYDCTSMHTLALIWNLYCLKWKAFPPHTRFRLHFMLPWWPSIIEGKVWGNVRCSPGWGRLLVKLPGDMPTKCCIHWPMWIPSSHNYFYLRLPPSHLSHLLLMGELIFSNLNKTF